MIEETLKQVPRVSDGKLPSDFDLHYPNSIQNLLVAGNIKMNEIAQNNKSNNWNNMKSHKLLLFYGDDDDYLSHNEDEYSAESRARHIKLAQKLGITKAQINFFQLNL